MSDTIPTEYALIQFIKGLAAELPGVPAPMTTNPTEGLAIAEPTFTTDTGQVFIGLDPDSGLPQVNRGVFPYNNIEVLTENSNQFLQNNFDKLLSDTGAILYPPQTSLPPRNGYILADNLLKTTGTPDYLKINGTNFAISMTNNPGNAQIYYYIVIYNSSTGNISPFKNGILKIFYSNDASEPSVTDACTSFQRYDTSSGDPNVVYGGIQFSALQVSNSLYLQYQNITTYGGNTPTSMLYMYFRIERSQFLGG